MPLKSEAQRRWMWANKPQMAREWEAVTPKDKKLPARSDGTDFPRRSDSTDFKGLHPGPKARHTYHVPAREQDSMAEGHGVKYQPGSRGRTLGVPDTPKGFRARDVRAAAVRTVSKR